MRRKTQVDAAPRFRLRGKNRVTRLECFTDCVFAFALTLLVVSLNVPKSYDELMVAMREMIGFAFCFAVFIGLWSRHHSFFQRYGLEDEVTKRLTACLLFVVLAYVYPLKFLSLVVVNMGLGVDRSAAATVFSDPDHQVRGLMLLYGGGLFVMSLLFFWFYAHAYAKRKELELTEIEALDTRWYAAHELLQAVVPLLSIALALMMPLRLISVAGWSYLLYGATRFAHHRLHEMHRKRMWVATGSSGEGAA